MFRTMPAAAIQGAKSLMARASKPRLDEKRTLTLLELESRVVPAITYIVSTFQDQLATDPTETLRYAISKAVTGDTIMFDPMDFSSSGAPPIVIDNGDLDPIAGDITVTGFGDNSFVKINGGGFVVFRTTSSQSVSLSGLTLRNSPGGINFSGGNLSLSNLKLHNSSSNTNGGAIRFDGGGTLSLANCTFVDNTATDSGGAISVGNGDLSIINSTFVNCTSKLIGGAIFVENGNVTIHGDGLGSTKEFSNCSTGATGGAIYVGDGSLQINDSILDGSSAGQKSTPGRGGALAVGHGQLTLADTIIRNATAAFGDGGGIIVGEGNVALFDTLIENCTAVGSLTSLPGDGGGIFITTGSLEMTHSQLRNNSAGRDGGAVRIGAGNATVYGDSGSREERGSV